MNLPVISYLEQEINFKTIEKKIIQNCEAIRTTIRNSIITECHFKNVNLSHCDLLSTKVYESSFDNVNFEKADIFTMWFSGCQFTNADFTGAGIEDITFINCSFQNCTFDGIGLKHCIFTDTEFVSIQPDSSTFTLNTYNKCTFHECFFKGSFQYQIFNNCKYSNVTLDTDLLKYNLGLGKSTGITYLHKTNILHDINIFKGDLISECIEQKLFINAVLIDYNFSDEINPALAVESIKAIDIMVQNNILLRNDEILFLKDLFHYLHINSLIAPIALYKSLEELKKICNKKYCSNIAIVKSQESLYALFNSLYFDFNKFAEQLTESIKRKSDYPVPIQIEIHYEQEPLIRLDTLLNEYFPGTFHRTSTKHGSFFEYLEVGQNGLEILKIFIQLLGISAPIIYSELHKEKTAKKTPKMTIQKDVDINIMQVHNKNDVSDLVQKTCQLINASDSLIDNQQGYSNNNIKEIKVNYHINIQT